MTRNSKTPLRFVGIGEVLFDVFEDGTATLGGAPLNVAVHAHQLATALSVGEGIIASRIGNDAAGAQICDALLDRGMSTQFLQSDPLHTTGTVSVFMRDGEPGYQIEADAAWDFLARGDALDKLAQSCDAVCFGSLAQRSEASRGTIRAFLTSAKDAIRLYDVNLRRNTLTREAGYSPEILEKSCELATIVKVNCSELVEISTLLGFGNQIAEEDGEVQELATGMLRRLSIPSLIVTRGSKGTTLYTNEGDFRGCMPITPLRTVHPVGAGDACSAGILFGLALGLSPDASVDLGNRMGMWVASHLSATPKLSDDVVTFVSSLARSLEVQEGGSLVETA